MTKTKTRSKSSCSDDVTAYALAVGSGEIVAGPHVRDACKRHLRDLERADLQWDYDAADRFFSFCRSILRLGEGQFDGKALELEPSQKFICGSLFGWKKPDGFRRFRRAYLEMGKGNGKSPMAGAIGLYGLVADGEAGAQIYAAGATKDQAGILFRDAVGMCDKAPSLGHDKIRRSGGPGREYNLAYLKTQSFFRPVSRETKKTGSGPRPHFALCDEVHEHPDGGVIEILERGFKFREQPLLVMITNSGSDRKSICWQERKHAVAVAAGDVDDDSTFSYVCSLDDSDDPFDDPSCWIKANPLLDVTITKEYLALQVAQAKNIAAKANGIKRLHFCIWTDAETAWMSRESWQAIEDHTLDIDQFEGKRCVAGLDLSAKADLTAKALMFEDGFTDDGQPKFAAFVHGYTPADTMMARAERDGAPYHLWADAGFITAVPGKKTRLDFVAQDLIDDVERFDVDFVAYDAYLIADFEGVLEDMGASLPMLDHPQGWNKRKRETEDGEEITLWMPGSVDMLETLILEGRIRVHVNPALRTAVMSATFDRSPADLRRFTKSKSTARIDMAVALAMAAGAATARLGQEFDHMTMVG